MRKNNILVIVLLSIFVLFQLKQATGSYLFRAGLNFPAGEWPISSALGDIDSDGDLDMVVGNNYSNNVLLLLGNGDGTFKAPIEYRAGYNTASVALGDLNGDGNLDIAVANGDSDDVSVLLGNGDSTFQSAVNYAAGEEPSYIVLGDLDGDGDLDIAVSNSGGFFGISNISVLLNNGDGTFQSSVNYSVGDRPNSIALGDLDGDSDLDMVVASFGSNSLVILLGNGNGTFLEPINYSYGYGLHSVVLGDLNNDGNLDIAVANVGNVLVLLGNGNATFQSGINYETDSGPNSIALGDLDGDRDLDIVAANNVNLSVLLGNSDGTFQDGVNYGVEASSDSAALGDLDGDGNLDIVFVDSHNANVSVLLGNGDGTFQDAAYYEAGVSSSSVALGDLNSDGDLDMVVASSGYCGRGGCSGSPGVSVLLGNGDSTFQSAVNYGAGPEPSSIALGDLDNDGSLDMVVGDDEQQISVLLGNGDGSFQDAVYYEAGDAPSSVSLGDLDKDGDQDIAVANSSDSNNVSVLLGNGDGTFQSAVNYTTGAEPSSVALGDLNGDGWLDIAVTNGDNVSVFLGNGDGTFRNAVSYIAGDNSRSVALGNLNKDDNLDMAVANDDNVSVLLGNGDGSFQSAVNYGDGNSSSSIALGDLDGNGNLDIAVENVLVLLGNGDGTFQSYLNFGAGYRPRSIALGDLDSDGDYDITVANYSNVSVLINNSKIPDKPIIFCIPQSHYFSEVTIDESKLQTFSCSNIGGLNLEIGDIVTPDTPEFTLQDTTTTCSKQIMQPGERCKIDVIFSPISVGDTSAILSIPSNAINSPIDISLDGTGIPKKPGISCIPFSHDYGEAEIGESKLQTFACSSTGSLDLEIGALSIFDSSPPEFTLHNDNCSTQTLAPGENCTVDIVFLPTSEGDKYETLSIPSNDPDSPLSLHIEGTGGMEGSQEYTLTMKKSGSGTGIVTSNPYGIDCGNYCTKKYDYSAYVELRPIPDRDSVFDGCSCDSDDSCSSISMERNITCTVIFNKIQPTHSFTVTKEGSGSGTVTSEPPGIDCGGDCVEYYEHGIPVTLTAKAANNSIFIGWKGIECDCDSGNDCTLIVDKFRICTAIFNETIPVDLEKGMLLKKKKSKGKDIVILKLNNCSNMLDVIPDITYSSVYITVLTADNNILYSKEIYGYKFESNMKETKYKYIESSPEKHKDILFLANNRIACKIKKTTIGEITRSEENTVGSKKDMRVQITIGPSTYEAVNTWTVVKDNKNKIKLIFK